MSSTASPFGAAPAMPLSEEFLRAVREGDLPRVRGMLDQDGSLIYARDRDGRSAYVLAHVHGRMQIALHLAERGFLMDAVEATLARNWDRVDEIGLSTPGAFDLDHPIGGTALYAGALFGVGRDVWRVQQYGADPNTNHRGADGVTPVRAAIDATDQNMALDALGSLLGNGGDPNRPQRMGGSVLHGAAAMGRLDMIRLIVRKGGHPDATDGQGRTPAQVAEDLGHAEAASLLRDHRTIARDHRTSRFAYRADGTVYTAGDLEGYDPRLVNQMVGASHFDLETAKSLTDRFPSMATAVSYFDEAAVEAPAHTGRHEVVALLLERGAPYSLPTAATMEDLPWARKLLEEDPLRVHERGAHDFPMMWYPAIGGHGVEMASLLLSHGADIAQEYMGTTALHFAVRGKREDLVRFLLDRGADPDAVGGKFTAAGETPLDLADAGDAAGIREMLEGAGASRRLRIR